MDERSAELTKCGKSHTSQRGSPLWTKLPTCVKNRSQCGYGTHQDGQRFTHWKTTFVPGHPVMAVLVSQRMYRLWLKSFRHSYDFKILEVGDEGEQHSEKHPHQKIKSTTKTGGGKTIAVGTGLKTEYRWYPRSTGFGDHWWTIVARSKVRPLGPGHGTYKISMEIAFSCVMACTTRWRSWLPGHHDWVGRIPGTRFRKESVIPWKKTIFDGRNLYDVDNLKELGFNYLSIGRPKFAERAKSDYCPNTYWTIFAPRRARAFVRRFSGSLCIIPSRLPNLFSKS